MFENIIRQTSNGVNLIKKIYLAGILLIVVLPIATFPPLFDPPAWGKVILFRIIFSVLIFVFLCQILYFKDKSILENIKSKNARPILVILFLLALFFIISTLFSKEIAFSFWGSPYRAGGSLNFVLYIAFAIFAFLVLGRKDWKLVWFFSLGTALAASAIAVLQKIGAFEGTLVGYNVRMPSTLGSPIFLALYLLFFIFLLATFAFLIKNRRLKIFYLACLLFFSGVILLTAARAVYLGLLIGLLYFILFYPRKIRVLKISVLALVIIGAVGVYFLNVYEDEIFATGSQIKQNVPLIALISRFEISLTLKDPRFSYWQIAANSIKEKPWLGFGPENFSIAYDKYYDPTLPNLDYGIIGQVDRAHSLIFDTAVTAGLPALAVYLALFIALLWQLQKTKKTEPYEKTATAHGLQAAIIAYFVAIFFSFDSFDTHLMFFLICSYCLHLISNCQENAMEISRDARPGIARQNRAALAPIVLLAVLFLGFIWFFNIKPLWANKELNWAQHYSDKGQFEKAISRAEKALSHHTFVDHYALLVYSDILADYQKARPERGYEAAQKSIQILEKAAKLRPNYTRTWLLLGSYYNFLVENGKNLSPEQKEEYLAKADSYFKKALQLNPSSQTIFVAQADTHILWQKYNEAKKISDQCLAINQNFSGCLVQKTIANIYLGQLERAEENLKINQNSSFARSEFFLSHLLKAYVLLAKKSKEINLQHYKAMADIYLSLIDFQPNNSQYHASLAYVYKTLGEYEKAKNEALIVSKLSPESKEGVENFLKTLP